MTHRRADVWLPQSTARCEPRASGCLKKMTCGRYLAPIAGAPLQDYSIGPDFPVVYWAAVCTDWLPVERPPATGPTLPTIHPSFTQD